MNAPVKTLAMRDALLQRIWLAMGEDPKIFFACADFGSPVLDKIRADYPDRFVNVGIAEQNLINVSAGLALEGYTVFAYAIAPFITMRCYEQIRVNLALLSQVRPMNVNLIGVGAGYSYVVSGPTHQCYEDITLMRAMPNMRVLSPADQVVAGGLFDLCIQKNGPKYLRLDAQVLPMIYTSEPDLHMGFHVHRQGKKVALIATGYMVHTALQVAEALTAEGVNVGVIDLFDLSEFDRIGLNNELARYEGAVSLEEGFHGRGGMDAMLFEFIQRENLPTRLLNLGVEGGYSFELGTRSSLHEEVGIGPHAVMSKVQNFLNVL
ncbi:MULTISPECIES: transketolase family protein [unclassified Paludibacterium]|uniref:transketolase family protein n=1 Tax=unclassified Paludibacterium TaxID=2618429 RepID=UPI001C03A8D4|nr:transketolase C-terminal domain-containing protein [Paludibacterium sp. B53371]BEV73299.1 transketolase C-terminal domain-containing protein [Paludibacterium sp. THUN1379]